MPILSILWANPVRMWPSLMAFFLRCFILPYWVNRILHDRPKEVRAMEHVIATTEPGDPEAVLRALDDFGRRDFLMNIGEKGPLLTSVVEKSQPRVVLELGGYLGYSAIDIARKLPEGGRLISVEMSPLHAALATKLIEWAGLADRVTVVIGESGKVIPMLRKRFSVETVDVVLLDHWKDVYISDLQLLEQEGYLARAKSVVVGDNVLFPGAPDFLAYVTATKPVAAAAGEKGGMEGRAAAVPGKEVERRRRFYYKTEIHEAHLEYNPHIKDLVTVSVPM